MTVPPTIRDVDLAGFVPTAIRAHLLSGGEDPEHRQATVAFLHFDGTDELLEREGPEHVAEALARARRRRAAPRPTSTTSRSSARDIDHDGGKIILVAGVPRAMGDDEERMLGDAAAHRRRTRAASTSASACTAGRSSPATSGRGTGAPTR